MCNGNPDIFRGIISVVSHTPTLAHMFEIHADHAGTGSNPSGAIVRVNWALPPYRLF